MIATDNHAHRLELMAYLEKHQLNQVQVILFDELKQSKISHQAPKRNYHRDRVQTLRWQAAKKIPTDQT